MGLVMGKCHQISTEISARYMPVFPFSDENLIKYQSIFTKLPMCIDIVEIWFGLLMVKFRQFLTKLSARHMIMVGYYHYTFFFFHVVNPGHQATRKNTQIINDNIVPSLYSDYPL